MLDKTEAMQPPHSETLSNLDQHFAKLMQKLDGGSTPELARLAGLVSHQTNAGHVCLQLTDLSDPELSLGRPDIDAGQPSLSSDPAVLRKILRHSSVVGQPGDFKPLILDKNDRLYLNRYWEYQDRLARSIKTRVEKSVPESDDEQLRALTDRYFSTGVQDGATDWQKVAAVVAQLKTFVVVSGGPGTGKTHTVAKIIALLLEQTKGRHMAITLVAPTGKAAIRLQESIKRVKTTLNCAPESAALIPEQAATIHRVLGYIPHSPYFRHDAENPLNADVLVVDEASMIDLALMSKLVQALKPAARIILLGDHNQLASVEAGSVFGDICDSGKQHAFSPGLAGKLAQICRTGIDLQDQNTTAGLHDCIIHLRKSYRFQDKPGIEALSEAVNEGNGDRALDLLLDAGLREIEWHSTAEEDIRPVLAQHFAGYAATDPATAFAQFQRVRILCAVRHGPQGVLALNDLIERLVKKRLNADAASYAGQPVLIQENDYTLNLFNGDLGILLPAADEQLQAHFENSSDSFRTIVPSRLPANEPAYAMTVHKSQGSEFDRVVLVLPPKDSPILTRELLYTGITRSREKVEIWGTKEVFFRTVARRIRRSSGLRDELWG